MLLAVIAAGLGLFSGPGLAQSNQAILGSANACDLNQDGTVNDSDYQLAIDMALGLTPCTANINGAGVCNVIVVQRVVNAALGGPCVTHRVSLNWVASTSQNVAGYNAYRATTSGGPYTKLNSSLVLGTSYTDDTVRSGRTYYYVATAVDTSGNRVPTPIKLRQLSPRLDR